MKPSFCVPLCIAGAMLLGAPSAQAVTLTFDNVRAEAQAYVEKGVLVFGDGDLGMHSSGSLHLDDSGTSAPSYVSFITGGIFDVLSFDLTPLGYNSAAPFRNVALVAHDATGLTRSIRFQMGKVGNTNTIPLGPMFTNLTWFAIANVNNLPFGEPNRPNGNYCFDSPCSHFNIDNVSINFATPAAVPLPAGFLLLASAIAGLGFVRRWRKS